MNKAKLRNHRRSLLTKPRTFVAEMKGQHTPDDLARQPVIRTLFALPDSQNTRHCL
jgi:hypothetical protein